MYFAVCPALVQKGVLRPDVVAVDHGAGVERFVRVVGDDAVGWPACTGERHVASEALLAELDLDLSMVHFPGQVNYTAYLRLLRMSKTHMYLTTRFVLSWS